MKNELITESVWQYLTKKVKATKNKSYVAVAYFGQGAAKMLPLKPKSVLLVDASEKAVKSGQTCPAELMQLHKMGVEIYSLPSLHAKMYVLGKSLLIGSANVSHNSSNVLFESLLSTTDTSSVTAAKEYILSLCGAELGEDELTRLQKMYKPPKMNGSGEKKIIKKTTQKDSLNKKLFVCKLDEAEWTPDEQKKFDEGEQEANKKRTETKKHILDGFRWDGKLTFKKYDEIIQIVDDGVKEWVFPPARLIHIKPVKTKKGNSNFLYLELPDKNAKDLVKIKAKLSKELFKKLYRNGYKNFEMAKTIHSWWRK